MSFGAEQLTQECAREVAASLGVPWPLKPPVGVIMLNTRFPRPVGDIGNALSFPFDVRFAIAGEATVQTVVTSPGESCDGSRRMLESVVAAGRGLVRSGCRTLTTSCGFLARHHAELHARFLSEFGVPVVTSSLLQMPFAASLAAADGGRVGVITFDAEKLGRSDLMLAGGAGPTAAPAAEVVVEGLQPGELRAAIGEDRLEMCLASALAEVLASARRMKELSCLVLECTNLAPYSGPLREELGIPVFDLTSLLTALVVAPERIGLPGES